VGRGEHGHGLGIRLDAKVRARELGDVGQLGVNVRGFKVSEVEQHVILVRPAAAALAHLVGHRPRHHVARGEVLDGGRVALHKALTRAVAQDRALAACGLGQQDSQSGEAGRVELEELHVLKRQAGSQRDAHAVARERVRVRGGLKDLACATCGEDDGLGTEHVDLARGQLVCDDACRSDLGSRLGGLGVLREQQVEHVVLVVELHLLLDALLVERLQDHVAGAVRCIARTAYGGLAVVARVPTKAALVDATVLGAVEGQTHLFEVEHSVDGLARHDLGGVLVNQVVATLNRVERVPLGVVVLDVRKRGGHAALSSASV